MRVGSIDIRIDGRNLLRAYPGDYVSIYVDFKRGDVHFQSKDTIIKAVADSQKIRQARFRLYASMFD